MKRAYNKPLFRELGSQPPQFTWVQASKHRTEPHARRATLENLGFVFAAICIVAGTILLSDFGSGPDTNSGARLLGGAALLNAGVIAVWIAAKSKLAWWRAAKEMREERGQF